MMREGLGLVKAVRFFEIDPDDEVGGLIAGGAVPAAAGGISGGGGVSGGQAEEGGITSNGEEVEDGGITSSGEKADNGGAISGGGKAEEGAGEVSAAAPAVPAVEEGSGTVIFDKYNDDEEDAPREATPVPGSWPEHQPESQPESAA